DVFRGRTVLDGVEARLAVGMEEPAALEQPRRARMRERGAGPEEAVLRLDPLVRDAGVVDGSALRDVPQLAEDVLGAGVGELLGRREAASDVAEDLPVDARARRPLHRLP